MKMSSIRCSRTTVVLLCLVGLLATAGVASAFTVSAEGVPAESAVEEEVTATYTIDDPFTDVSNEWTLEGETDLRDVAWTVTVLRAGNQISQETYGDQSFDQDLDVDDNGDEVRIEVTGTVPTIENYTYDPEERYTVASLSRVSGNNEEEFRNDSAHHYTEESREARMAIEDAEDAIDAAGGNQQAEQLRQNAISAYNSEDFDNAVDLANQAESAANSASQTRTLLLVAGAIIALLALIGGGYYLYSQSQEDDYSKL